MKTFLVIFALFFSNSCSGIKLLAKGNPQDLYDKQFLVQVDKSKELFRTGNTDKALKVLEAIDESKIKPVEIALKNNLIGVIFFGLKNYGKALDKFLTALTTSEEDSSLTSQIHLNIAGVYYKQNEHEKAYTSLLNIRFESLAPIEATKANKLLFIVAKHIGNEEHATIALVRI
jgi:tetratricopeptide (TPR) repeat protein